MIRAVAALMAVVLSFGPVQAADTEPFVTTRGTQFEVDGRPFRVAGVNNHYLTYASEQEVIRVLDDAVAMNATVVRTIVSPILGAPDASVLAVWDWKSKADASNLGVNGAWMAAWDPTRKAMVINEGPTGLGKLDFLLVEARKRRLRVIFALLDFWHYTGGAQQMRAWYGSTDVYTFFAEDRRTRADYKTFVQTVITRTNARNGIAYRDDPTIFAWELMNEPDIHPLPLLKDWIEEMSAFIKSLDRRHLLATGHSSLDLQFEDARGPHIDFATWHAYRDYQKITTAQYSEQIKDFCEQARAIGKPALLEEFGLRRDDPSRTSAFRVWLEAIRLNPNCAGWIVWRLVGKQDHGSYPTDEHDQFDIHNDGSPTWTVLRDAAAALRGNS